MCSSTSGLAVDKCFCKPIFWLMSCTSILIYHSILYISAKISYELVPNVTMLWLMIYIQYLFGRYHDLGIEYLSEILILCCVVSNLMLVI